MKHSLQGSNYVALYVNVQFYQDLITSGYVNVLYFVLCCVGY